MMYSLHTWGIWIEELIRSPYQFYVVHYLYILIAYKYTFICLLNLKYKEEGKFSHHTHFELFVQGIGEFFTKANTENNVINIRLKNNQVFIFFVFKEKGFASTLHMLKPLLTRTLLRLLCWALGICFKPFKALFWYRHDLGNHCLQNQEVVGYTLLISIKKNTFYINLKTFKVHATCKSKQHPNSLKTSCVCKCLIKSIPLLNFTLELQV